MRPNTFLTALARTFLFTLALLVTLPVTADGVFEINQACALKGCFSGDSAGFPVTITDAGHYRLTGDLFVTPAGMDAITVETSFVTIDLAGFSLQGPFTCSGIPVSCTGTGTGWGIATAIGDQIGITVQGGTIHGFGSGAVQLDDYAIVENLRALGNVDSGIRTGSGSQILNSIACLNNFGDSFLAGIEANSGSRIVGNVACGNRGIGILTGGPGNIVHANTVWSNSKDGILSGIRASIMDNVVYDNGGAGINMSDSASAWGRNTVNDNDSTASSGTEIEENLCDGSLSCP